MKAREILCLAILQQDVESALKTCRQEFILGSGKLLSAQLQLLEERICRESVFLALRRFLRTHGIPHSSSRKIAQNIITINGCRIFLISYAIDADSLTVDQLLQTPVFLPPDFTTENTLFERILFVFITAPFRLILRTELASLMRKPVVKSALHLAFSQHKIFLTAAPDLAECQQKFRECQPGTVCLQAPGGLQHITRGALNKYLTPFVEVFDWHGV